MSVKQNIWAFFKEKGLSDEAVAGIMGNVAVESNYSSTAENESSGAFGLFQWLGSRYYDLVSYAQKTGNMVSDVDTQLNFAWYEMQTTEKKTLEALQSNKYSSPSEYAEAFDRLYERSEGTTVERRQEEAEKAYSEYTGKEYDYEKVLMIDEAKGGSLGLKWWGDVVRIVLLIGLILTGVIFLYLAIMSFGGGNNGDKK